MRKYSSVYIRGTAWVHLCIELCRLWYSSITLKHLLWFIRFLIRPSNAHWMCSLSAENQLNAIKLLYTLSMSIVVLEMFWLLLTIPLSIEIEWFVRYWKWSHLHSSQLITAWVWVHTSLIYLPYINICSAPFIKCHFPYKNVSFKFTNITTIYINFTAPNKSNRKCLARLQLWSEWKQNKNKWKCWKQSTQIE